MDPSYKFGAFALTLLVVALLFHRRRRPVPVPVKPHFPNHFFVFDVESLGLRGPSFAFGWTVMNRAGLEVDSGLLVRGLMEFELRAASPKDFAWAKENIPDFDCPRLSRSDWLDACAAVIQQAMDCGAAICAETPYPVETRFLSLLKGITVYPLFDISSILAAAGMDPMKTYERIPGELPRHCPRADARQSARLLATALNRIDPRHDTDGAIRERVARALLTSPA